MIAPKNSTMFSKMRRSYSVSIANTPHIPYVSPFFPWDFPMVFPFQNPKPFLASRAAWPAVPAAQRPALPPRTWDAWWPWTEPCFRHLAGESWSWAEVWNRDLIAVGWMLMLGFWKIRDKWAWRLDFHLWCVLLLRVLNGGSSCSSRYGDMMDSVWWMIEEVIHLVHWGLWHAPYFGNPYQSTSSTGQRWTRDARGFWRLLTCVRTSNILGSQCTRYNGKYNQQNGSKMMGITSLTSYWTYKIMYNWWHNW